MNQAEYQTLALTTESVPTELKIGEVGLHMALTAMIQTGIIADKVKRAIFYGTPLDKEAIENAAHDAMDTLDAILENLETLDTTNDREGFELEENLEHIHPENIDLRKLHAGLGLFSESAEILEALRSQLETGKIDKVNFAEELGDCMWYVAIGADATDLTLDRVMHANIMKLDSRNKQKGGTGVKGFNADGTINRDTAAERAILESNLS